MYNKKWKPQTPQGQICIPIAERPSFNYNLQMQEHIIDVKGEFSQDQNKICLSSQAFICLQHGFLRTVENVYIYNLVNQNGVWENIFLNDIDTYFNF